MNISYFLVALAFLQKRNSKEVEVRSVNDTNDSNVLFSMFDIVRIKKDLLQDTTKRSRNIIKSTELVVRKFVESIFGYGLQNKEGPSDGFAHDMCLSNITRVCWDSMDDGNVPEQLPLVEPAMPQTIQFLTWFSLITSLVTNFLCFLVWRDIRNNKLENLFARLDLLQQMVRVSAEHEMLLKKLEMLSTDFTEIVTTIESIASTSVANNINVPKFKSIESKSKSTKCTPIVGALSDMDQDLESILDILNN